MTVTLTWADGVNPPGTTYNVYRKPTNSSGAYTEAASGLTAMTFAEQIADGSYNYTVSASLAGIESNQAPVVVAAVPLVPPSNLAVTVKLP